MKKRAMMKACAAMCMQPKGANATLPPGVVSGGGAYFKRKSPRVVGRGAYFAPDYFERLGEGFFGNRGKLVGEGVYDVLKAFGLGKYKVKRNSLVQKLDMGDEVPRVRNSNQGEGFVIQHEEYIGDLLTGTGTPTPFATESFNINPANPELFPFLSAIAENFEEYEFRGLLFTLKSLASEATTALSLGSHFGAVQYDVNDPAFTNKQELENYQYANSKKVSKSFILPVECAKGNDVLAHLYTAPSGVIPAGADSKFYNLGRLTIGSQGCPAANTPIAELWVSYEIALFKPKLTAGGDLQTATITAHYYSTDFTNAKPLGQTWNSNYDPSSGSYWSGSISSAGGGTISFPPNMTEGVFQVTVRWTGTAATFGAPTVTTANCTAVNMYQADTVSKVFCPQNGLAGVTDVMFNEYVSITGTNAQLTIGSGTFPAAGSVDIFITQVNGNIN